MRECDVGTVKATNALDAAARAADAVPPLWPLASSVAVNPFLSQGGDTLAVASARLRRVAGVRLTMPRDWYAERIAAGDIAEADILAALSSATSALREQSLADFKRSASAKAAMPLALPTIADLAEGASGIAWTAFIAERIGRVLADYFDEGQALWPAHKGRGVYASWRQVAAHDLTPEITGLSGFCADVAATPECPAEAIAGMVASLGLVDDELEAYFHRLLMSLGGWAQLARHRLWQAQLSGQSDTTLIELIAIRLCWETVLIKRYGRLVQEDWQRAAAAYAQPLSVTEDDRIDAVLQEATERAVQRRLQACLSRQPTPISVHRPTMQMAFCIDVRSEVFRRALESVDPSIQTLGFAGFFGLGIGHRRFASDVVEARLPVLLKPSMMTCSVGDTDDAERRDAAARVLARAKRAWERFKVAAISSFAFVEAAGPVYAAKLLRDGLQVMKAAAPDDPGPRFEPALDLTSRISISEKILRAMSLTEGFARLVIIAGHGASVLNNPHASALQCGACGGYSGEVNARLLSNLLNEVDVRAGLADRGVVIPDDTYFVPALHDTTTDIVKLYEADATWASHADAVAQAKQWISKASSLARDERALRLPRARNASDTLRRAHDWAEVRPEWGLAGCQAFIAAPRVRTTNIDLEGRVFLHDYVWQRDTDFSVLETILTAPVVVASWINLQYYGSVVAPGVFGAGNKLLHNVVGGVGVLEGNGGNLRAGLPWQSVHSGEKLVHQPLRLSVLIEAPRDAILAILARHAAVNALFENRWLHLFVLDEYGRIAWRYGGNRRWEPVRSIDETSGVTVATA